MVVEDQRELGLPLLVTWSGAEGRQVGAPTLPGTPRQSVLSKRAVLPLLAQNSIASLVFNGVFQRYPSLHLAFVGFGGAWLEPFLWRLTKEWQSFRYDVPWVDRSPEVYVQEHVTLIDSIGNLFTTAASHPARPPLDQFGTMFAYGSSFPYASGDGDIAEQLAALGVAPRHVTGVLHDHAARAFPSGVPA